MTTQETAAPIPMWRRCRCDQYGRCLTDCPSADLRRPGPWFYYDRKRAVWVERP